MEPSDLIGNGLRVLLTGRCNYHCFFCHNEGIDPASTTEAGVSPELIAEFIKAGARNLTISGGEPLLAFSKLQEFLEGLNLILTVEQRNSVDLTIVTNGSLLDDKKLDVIANLSSDYAGLRFNISLHTPDPETYEKITGTKNQHERVVGNISRVLNRNFPVCLNFVLLRSHNGKEDELEAIMRFSSELGVSRIKIIEFLVTDLNKRFYSSFSRLEPIMYNNRHRASRQQAESRRKTSHFYPEYGLQVDYSRCTCALGCSSCMETREIEIVPGNEVVGCIYRPPISLKGDETPAEITGIIISQLEEMVARYGEYSPSLVFEPENVHSIARFQVKQQHPAKALFGKGKVVSYRKYLRYELGSLPNSEYEFLLIEYESSTHSKLVCFKKSIKSNGNVNWIELEYFDPVYEFSRTRSEVNRRKIDAMGFILPKGIQVEEESVVLSRNGGLITILKKLSEGGMQKLIMEIAKICSDDWESEEPLKTAYAAAEEYNLTVEGNV
jgi:molybdenum cofactor biosynthesis enzyme MoaA